ncbi:aminoacyl-tRNA deacylase [Vibrio sp. SCSIO 43137]|uniref:aminoacyl-tRNA deacylase n=1 Tax=Vibrio sp. SCSIO 43137 TaxID=3021011 RepID=UPI0023082CBA|nr:YbaK/EbsC family protein [Vibrio sp. SCSIO 43137]WCE28652.1 YbaK/EbsC family protein [Vibrio sp. SCSIO 43137]
MTMSTRLDHYLAKHHIPYKTVEHSHSNSSIHSAVVSRIPAMNVAKGIVLEDHEGRHLMAVLPANAKISFTALNEELHANFHMVKEREVYRFFEDCENGAVPPIGGAYHMAMVCDDSLMELDNVYLEAGDHETLIKLDQQAFRKLMSNSKCMSFGSQVFH